MSKVQAVVGPSSTGKTTSLRNMDPNTTYIINVLGKDLPWKGSRAQYSEERKNTKMLDNWNDVIEAMKLVSQHKTEVTDIIIDDAGYLMTNEFFARARESGYNKFSEIGQHMFQVINTAKNLRDDLTVTFMFHEQLELTDGQLPQRSIKTIGKMLSEKFEPEAAFSVLLYTRVTFDEDGNAKYQFVTNKTPDYPAKSPMGMFDSLYIPNDMKEVINQINHYYHA